MSHFLDSLKWSSDGLVAVIAQVPDELTARPCLPMHAPLL